MPQPPLPLMISFNSLSRHRLYINEPSGGNSRSRALCLVRARSRSGRLGVTSPRSIGPLTKAPFEFRGGKLNAEVPLANGHLHFARAGFPRFWRSPPSTMAFSDIIPPEHQLAATIVISVVGFLLVLVMSKVHKAGLFLSDSGAVTDAVVSPRECAAQCRSLVSPRWREAMRRKEEKAHLPRRRRPANEVGLKQRVVDLFYS
eukprot:scaffold5340_cov257-Pinguiococcus_pyrenoidosus.AAC.3